MGSVATVLIVDDELDIRETLSDVLRGEGYEVQLSGNGQEAIDYLEKSPPPALILLDLMMPEMDGWQFRVQQRANSQLASIPVIAMTANQTSQAAAIDAQGFLPKPFNVTALLRLVQEVLRSAEAEKERRTEQLLSLGRLAGGVAHEINNPLAYVLSNLQMIQDQLAPMLKSLAPGNTPMKVSAHQSEELNAMFTEALEGASRIRTIVRDIQVATDVRPERLEPAPVEAVLESALGTLGARVGARAKVERRYGDTLPVGCERGRLEQAFVCILQNALDALPADRVEQNEISIRTYLEESRVCVQITDNGEGIGQRTLPRVFDPFFTTRPVGCGTGLGLFIARGIFGALGGTVSAESMVGRGSTFTVKLPFAARKTAPANNVVSVHAARPSVLIIDDDELVGRALARRLNAEYQVKTVSDGDEALSLLCGADYDLVLCDLHMPNLTGMDLYAAVKSARPGAEQRIVFMTGAAFTEESRVFAARVENPVLEKPVDPLRLKPLLQRRVA